MLEKPPMRIDLLVPEHRRLRAPEWLDVTRAAASTPCSVVGRLRVASPADAVVRGLSSVAPRDRASVVYRATQRRLVGVPQLRDALARTARVPERRRLESIIRAVERGAESFLEERALRTIFNTREFSRLIPQHDYFLEGYTYRIDLYDPATKTAFEMDSKAHHGTWADRVRDMRRDAHLATDGVLTVRFPYEDVVERPAECRRVAVEVMRGRE
jgi:very-short-patch-repair endonuclease